MGPLTRSERLLMPDEPLIRHVSDTARRVAVLANMPWSGVCLLERIAS